MWSRDETKFFAKELIDGNDQEKRMKYQPTCTRNSCDRVNTIVHNINLTSLLIHLTWSIRCDVQEVNHYLTTCCLRLSRGRGSIQRLPHGAQQQ